MPLNKKNSQKKQTVVVKVGENVAGKLPPQAIDMEEAVLGALMIDPDAYSTISDLLKPSCFYKDQHRYIYEAIQALASEERPIDILEVVEKLKAMDTLEEAGGVTYINDLTRRVSSSAHLYYHAEVVAQKATARELIAMAAELTELGYDETADVQETLQKAEADIFQISQQNQKRDFEQIDVVIDEAYKRMQNASKNEGNISGVPSGFHALDKITSGWQKSDLIIIAARPAMGKTAFVLSMAKNIAVNYNIPVAIFSLEMSKVQLANRLIMNACEIEGDKIKTGKLTQDEWKKYHNNITTLLSKPIYLDDTPALSVFELKSKARRLVKDKKVQIIIIDYLQLMNANGINFGSREQEVSIISRNLKQLAKELDIPIIALSQLNRSVEQRSSTGVDGKKPQLSDLRESGAIEQDADMVCFIHRPEYYRIYTDEKQNKDLRGLGQIIVAKHRNGATDEIWLRFIGKYARFANEDETVDGEDYIPPYDSGNNFSYGYPQSASSISMGSKMNIIPPETSNEPKPF